MKRVCFRVSLALSAQSCCLRTNATGSAISLACSSFALEKVTLGRPLEMSWPFCAVSLRVADRGGPGSWRYTQTEPPFGDLRRPSSVYPAGAVAGDRETRHIGVDFRFMLQHRA